MTDDISDQAFADRAIKQLSLAAPSPRLEAALLAAYDAWNARREEGPWAAFRAGLRGFFDIVWPGAPVWAPLSAFAAALIVGISLGIVLPPLMSDEPAGFSLDRPSVFSLSPLSVTQEDL